MFIVQPESTPTAYFKIPSHQSVCLYVYSVLVARQRLGKTYRGNEYPRGNTVAGHFVLYVVLFV
jgi:hypothetical protein